MAETCRRRCEAFVIFSTLLEVTMGGTNWMVFVLVISPFITEAWKTETRWPAEVRVVHNHRKRHNVMDPPPPPPDAEARKRSTAVNKLRENRKKPSGHLTPLDEDDMDNDEVVSVAVGPPPIRPKFDKLSWKPRTKPERTKIPIEQTNVNPGATNLVKDVLTQLGREFLTHQVNEDFVFGQYVGNAMRGLLSDSKLRMQHEILELVVKYQKLNRTSSSSDHHIFKKHDDVKLTLNRERKALNETEDVWPDFTNLAKIVGK